MRKHRAYFWIGIDADVNICNNWLTTSAKALNHLGFKQEQARSSHISPWLALAAAGLDLCAERNSAHGLRVVAIKLEDLSHRSNSAR